MRAARAALSSTSLAPWLQRAEHSKKEYAPTLSATARPCKPVRHSVQYWKPNRIETSSKDQAGSITISKKEVSSRNVHVHASLGFGRDVGAP
jgi:hypothetical protein